MPAPVEYNPTGGFAERSKNQDGPDYIGPAWFTEGMKDVY
jgi:hypothetical protein